MQVEESPNIARQKKENLKSSVLNKSKVNVYYEVRSSNEPPDDLTQPNKSYDSPSEIGTEMHKTRNPSLKKVLHDDRRS